MVVKLRHPHAERGLDCYPTAPPVTHALLREEDPPSSVWEPACGHGHIAEVLRGRGYHVITSDITHYDYPLDFQADFLTVKKAPPGVASIVTNAPYCVGTKFARHALDLVSRVYLFTRLSFLASVSRTDILE